MPVKRRLGKARILTDEQISEHFYGPGSSLLAGCGYWSGDFYWNLPEEAQHRVVAEMRGDWNRNADRILLAWEGRSEHQLYIADTHYAGQVRPWSEARFGRPS